MKYVFIPRPYDNQETMHEEGSGGYQVSTKCSFGYFSLDTPTPFAVLTVFLDNT